MSRLQRLAVGLFRLRPGPISLIMNKAVIFGATDFSELILAHLQRDSRAPEIAAFAVGRDFLGAREQFCGLPLIAAENLPDEFPPEDCGVYVTLGYRGMNAGRRLVFERLRAAGYRLMSYVHPSARLEGATIGEGIIALANVTVDDFCVLGDGNIFQIGVLAAHHTVMGDFNFFAPGACVTGQVRIGHNCFFGANSTIRNGLTIGDRSLVGAGAYVDRDTAPDSVVVPPRSVLLEGRGSLEMGL